MSYKYHLPMNEDINLGHIDSLIENEIREDKTIDYKRQPSKSILKTICGFLNTLGGHLVIGVEEEEERPINVCGFNKNDITDLTRSINDSIHPAVDLSLDIINLPKNDQNVVVVIQVPRRKGMWFLSKGVFFVRQGDSTNPILSEFEKDAWKKNHPENYSRSINNFKENYLIKLSNKFSRLHIHGFPIEVSSLTKPVSLVDLYVPPPLLLNKPYEISNRNDEFFGSLNSKFPWITDTLDNNMQNLSKEIYNFSNVETQFKFLGYILRTYPRVVFLGYPGSGKSTLMNFLCLYFSKESNDLLGHQTKYIPFYIDSKKYSNFTEKRAQDGRPFSLFEYIVFDLANQYSFEIDTSDLKKQVSEILVNGNGIVLIDALDEIISITKQKELVAKIQSFSKEYNMVKVLISSRIQGYGSYSLPDEEFIHASIMPLKYPFIEDFIYKWFKLTEINEVSRKEKITYLIDQIKSNRSLNQLSSNPLILTLICIILKIGVALPSQQYELYSALSKTLTITREKEKDLGIVPNEYLEQILSEIAFNTMILSESSTKSKKMERKLLIKIIVNFFVREFEDEKLIALEKAKKLVEEFIERPHVLIPMENHFVFWHQTFLDYYSTIFMRKMYLQRRSDFNKIIRHKLKNVLWWEIIHLTIESLDELSREMANDYSSFLYNVLLKQKIPNSYLLRRISQKRNVNQESKNLCIKKIIEALDSVDDNFWVSAVIELQQLVDVVNEEEEQLVILKIMGDLPKFQKIFQTGSNQIAPLNDLLNKLHEKNKLLFTNNLRFALRKNNLEIESVLVEKFVNDEIDYNLIESILTLNELELENFTKFHCFRKFLKQPTTKLKELKVQEEKLIQNILSLLHEENFKNISIEQLSLTITFLNKSLGKTSIKFTPGNFLVQPNFKQDKINKKAEDESQLDISERFNLKHSIWISDTIIDFFSENSKISRIGTRHNFVSKGKPISNELTFLQPIVLTQETPEITFEFNMQEGFYFEHPNSSRFRINLNSNKVGFSQKYIFGSNEDHLNWKKQYKDFKNKVAILGFNIIEEEELFLFKKAVELYNSKDFEETVSMAEQIIDIDSSFADAYRLKAKSLAALNKFKDSMLVCKQYNSFFKENKDVQLQIIANYVNLNQYSTALEKIKIFEEKHTLEPDKVLFFKEHKGISLYNVDKDNTQTALKLFNEIMKEEPLYYRAYYHKAMALVQINKFQACLNFLNRKKSNIEGDFPLILIPRLLCYINLKLMDDAVTTYKKIKDANIHEGLIISSREEDSEENEAELFFNRILAEDPTDENALISQAIFFMNDNLLKAQEIIAKVIDLYPNNPYAWFFKGEIEVEQGLTEEGICSIVQAYKLNFYILNNIKGREKLEKLEIEINKRIENLEN